MNPSLDVLLDFSAAARMTGNFIPGVDPTSEFLDDFAANDDSK